MPPLTVEDVLSIFLRLSSKEASVRTSFFDHVLEDVNWTVMGHSPMSKTYTSKSDFLNATISGLGNQVLKASLRMHAYNVIVAPPSTDGSQQAVVEMKAIDAVCRNGMVYDMTYCWVCTFSDLGEDGGRKISRVRAYIDSELLRRAMRANVGGKGDDKGFGKVGLMHHE